MSDILSTIKKKNSVKEYPLIPLRNVVVFPKVFVPLSLGRQYSLQALKEAEKNNGYLVFSAQKDATVDSPNTKQVFQIGTLAAVRQVFAESKDNKILVEGIKRVNIKKFTQIKPFYKVEVEELEEVIEHSKDVEALKNAVLSQFKKIVTLGKSIPMESLINILSLEDVHSLADYISGSLDLKVGDKQRVLEQTTTGKKLAIISEILSQEISVLQLGKKMESKAHHELSKMQKEVILREQLRTIQKELGGEDEEDEGERIGKKIKSLKLPEEVEEKVMKDVNRFARMPSMNPESSYLRSYLETIIDLPWNKKSKEQNDIKKAKEILDEDHYGLERPKDRILEYLAVHQLVGKMRGSILCFVGPPGTGKTSIGRSIAKALNRKFVKMSLGGVHDEAEIRGHRRTYVGALPGRIIQGVIQSKSNNPVFMLDEIDKVGSDFRGDPSAALLEALDPEQNHSFSDHYLEVPFDLSDVMFITTANVLDTIPPALRDRMEVIRYSGYTEDEKYHIGKDYLIPRLVKSHGLSKRKIRFDEKASRKIIQDYTREAGVRNFERELSSILRKIARKISEKKQYPKTLTEKDIVKLLGPRKYSAWLKEEKDESGVATGLAWTQSGGDILSIESTYYPGKGKLIITGQLGDVMKESAQAALSYTKTEAKQYKIDPKIFEKNDFHIHVPEGAIPKDGPSAGVTLTTSLVSLFSGKKVRKDIGMTGEITLRGKVLEIGGVKEKVLAAHRAGLKKLLLPAENKKDLEKDVPEEVRKDLEFVFVKHVSEVLKEALV